MRYTQHSFKAYYTYGQDANNYYSDYGYQVPQEASLDPFSLSQDRTGGLEAFITAPLVVTAFIAALFGGRSNLIYPTVIKVRSLLTTRTTTSLSRCLLLMLTLCWATALAGGI